MFVGDVECDHEGDPPTFPIIVDAREDDIFGPESKIRMYDGSVKLLKDIKMGEQYLGKNGTQMTLLDVKFYNGRVLRIGATRTEFI
jgi:hypothetical protein